MIFPLVVIDSVLWPADSSATVIPAPEMPEPYRGLLAHTHHMTVTIEAHYGRPVDVCVLESGHTGDDYHRRIVLKLHGTDRTVQYGLVRINLALLDADVRAADSRAVHPARAAFSLSTMSFAGSSRPRFYAWNPARYFVGTWPSRRRQLFTAGLA